MADMLADAQPPMPTADEVKELFEQLGIATSESPDSKLLPPPPDFLLNSPNQGHKPFEMRTSNVSIWDAKALSQNA